MFYMLIACVLFYIAYRSTPICLCEWYTPFVRPSRHKERRSTTYNHRALNDAEDAVEALRWVRAKFFQPPARRPNGAVLLDRRLTST